MLAFEVQDERTLVQGGDIAKAVRRSVQDGIGLTVEDVVPLAPGVPPKTSSGKLQRAKTRKLYEAGELVERKGVRDQRKLELAKQATLSQLSYFKLAVLGGRREEK